MSKNTSDKRPEEQNWLQRGMSKIRNPLKRIGSELYGVVKAFGAPYLIMRSAVLALFSVAGFMNMAEDDQSYRLANDLSEYMEYKSSEIVQIGSDVDDVIPVQLALDGLGYDLGVCGVDGMYLSNTSSAVEQFQKDKDLPVDGIVGSDTYNALINEMEARPDVYASVQDRLIAPFQEENIQDIVDDAEDIIDDYSFQLIFNPMVDYAFWSNVGNFMEASEAEEKFKGCANIHLADAFRHASATWHIANDVNVSAAIGLMDFREKLRYHGRELFMMDITNHRLALELREEFKEKGLEGQIEPNDYLMDAANDGRLIIYPFPLVPSDFDHDRGKEPQQVETLTFNAG